MMASFNDETASEMNAAVVETSARVALLDESWSSRVGRRFYSLPNLVCDPNRPVWVTLAIVLGITLTVGVVFGVVAKYEYDLTHHQGGANLEELHGANSANHGHAPSHELKPDDSLQLTTSSIGGLHQRFIRNAKISKCEPIIGTCSSLPYVASPTSQRAQEALYHFVERLSSRVPSCPACDPDRMCGIIAPPCMMGRRPDVSETCRLLCDIYENCYINEHGSSKLQRKNQGFDDACRNYCSLQMHVIGEPAAHDAPRRHYPHQDSESDEMKMQLN